jgi:hypothetical protein
MNIKQKTLAQWLSSSFDPFRLKVLELGSTTTADGTGQKVEKTNWQSYGLILLSYVDDRGEKYFHRLGCCYWEDYHSVRRRDEYSGCWSECDGVFG